MTCRWESVPSPWVTPLIALEEATTASRYPHVRWIAAAATTGLRQPSSISSCPSSSLFHTRIDAWPQQWDNARAMTAWQGVSTPMQSAHCAMSYVLCIGLERTRWISNGYAYPSDLDMVTIFRPSIFYGWAGTASMDMDMDLILFNPIQTRPIAILTCVLSANNS